MIRPRRAWPAAGVVLLVLAVGFVGEPREAMARPGGGQSYARPRASTPMDASPSSPGTDGNRSTRRQSRQSHDDLVAFVQVIFRMLITMSRFLVHPSVSLPLGALLSLVSIAVVVRSTIDDWTSPGPVRLALTEAPTGASLPREAAPRPAAFPKPRQPDPRPPRPALLPVGLSPEAILAHHPGFSLVLFEDFVLRLYVAAHSARGTSRELESLAPYVSASARKALENRPPVGQPVREVVVGALRTTSLGIAANGLRDGAPAATAVVEIEANYVDGPEPGALRFAEERWVLRRALTATTAPPRGPHGFPCPHCGASWILDDVSGERCASCGQAVDGGRFDWWVESVTMALEVLSPEFTAGGRDDETPETRWSATFADAWHSLCADDPSVTESTVGARLRAIFEAVNDGWNRGTIEPARLFVSAALADYLTYGLRRHAAQGVRNVLEEARLNRSQMVKLVRDRHYDALTIRIFASGRDYTVRVRDGARVAGDKHFPRDYSEYWTLIRSATRPG